MAAKCPVSPTMILSHLVKGMVKFPFFDQNHGLTPLRNSNMATV